LTQFLQETFQDSVFDFAGVRVNRRTDRFPAHPADGTVVAEGIFEAIKDENLTEGQVYYYGVWTFNKELNFSVGQFVQSTPTDRILPRGVNLASAFPRILPGVERDNNTQLIYSFVEGAGFLVFDSSGSGLHGIISAEVIEENFWSGDASTSSFEEGGAIKKPVGVRFDGEFDIIEVSITNDSDFVTNSSQNIVVNFWLLRYSKNQEQWIIGTSTETASNNIGWSIGLTSSNTIGVAISDVSSGLNEISASIIPEKKWTMITIEFIDSSGSMLVDSLFIDGVRQTLTTTPSGIPATSDRIYIGGKPESSAAVWTGGDFFGAINQISIHNTNRSDTYISNLYNFELDIFNQPANQVEQDPPDNKQREVLLSWNISEDFDFQGGTVTIVRKYNKVPSNIEDGTQVLIRTINDAGQFFFMDSFDFVNSGNYYYRIFTTNSIGNISDRLDARILSVAIPLSKNDPAIPPLSPITNEAITSGNKKLFLQWTNPIDTRLVGTRIYFSTKGFPTVSINAQGTLQISDGVLIADTTNSSFVHRITSVTDSGVNIPLKNGISHYYTIITYDKFNRISESKFLIGVPSSLLSTIFQPEEVKDLHIEVLNPQTLSIQWINPIVKSEEINLFFGETFISFCKCSRYFRRKTR